MSSASTNYPIRYGIPIPPARRPPPRMPRKYPFEEMEVGGSFLIPNKKRNTLSTHASTVGKELGRKFSTRLVHMRKGADGKWVECEETDQGAVLGIGVWREE